MKKILYISIFVLFMSISQPMFSNDTKGLSTNSSSNQVSEDAIIQKNKQKFSALKQYNLPAGKYAIGGSGPLGIRGIREINDIDILVSDELRDDLIKKYGIVDDGKTKKVSFPNGDIDAFWEGSFYTQKGDPNDPKVKDIILHAEIIDDLPFESLDNIIYFKRKMNRPKDLEDIKLIEKWKKKHN